MKRHFYLLVFLPAILFAQVDSLKELLNYYPLQTGNYWEYQSYWEQMPFSPTDSSSHSVEVTGDTLLENGHTYKILLRKDITPNQYQYNQFERIDSLTGCVYRYINDTTANHEYMSDSLFAQPGDPIYSSRERITTSGYYMTRCVSVTNDSIFGIFTQLKTFQNECFIPGETYTFAKGFGELYGSVCEMGCGSTYLVYAKIDGKEFGKKLTSINSDKNFSPNLFILNQNFPNPFNPSTVISFQLSANSKVSLKVYDVLGNQVAILVDGEKPAGNYKIDFDGSRLSNGISSKGGYASGVYFYTLRAGSFVQSRKMILLK
ncbi:MAG: T9SS type A sorting domain-containing protein [Ignavibacteria bacterium]|nr:T9SS type A sorting domain-containing protein [Ignavibacteria bacterium]